MNVLKAGPLKIYINIFFCFGYSDVTLNNRGSPSTRLLWRLVQLDLLVFLLKVASNSLKFNHALLIVGIGNGIVFDASDTSLL